MLTQLLKATPYDSGLFISWLRSLLNVSQLCTVTRATLSALHLSMLPVKMVIK